MQELSDLRVKLCSDFMILIDLQWYFKYQVKVVAFVIELVNVEERNKLIKTREICTIMI